MNLNQKIDVKTRNMKTILKNGQPYSGINFTYY